MIILTVHGEKRVHKRYPGSVEAFKKEVLLILKKIAKKKISNYRKKIGLEGEIIIYYRDHKIVYFKAKGDYIIITYGRRILEQSRGRIIEMADIHYINNPFSEKDLRYIRGEDITENNIIKPGQK